MDNELETGSGVRGRIFHTSCAGDTAAEIEIAALTAAQAFFGNGVPLEVMQDYQVTGTTPSDRTDKKHRARVRVRAILQG